MKNINTGYETDAMLMQEVKKRLSKEYLRIDDIEILIILLSCVKEIAKTHKLGWGFTFNAVNEKDILGN